MKTVHAAREKRKLAVTGCFFLGLAFLLLQTPLGAQEASPGAERDPVTISVVVANPSKVKIQTIPVKIDLPKEITPADILENEGMQVQYDDQRSMYFLFNEKVELQPKQTRIFNVQVKDVWFIDKRILDEYRSEADRLLARLDGTEYYDSGKRLHDLIGEKLTGIHAKQNDETLGQKNRIGAYRINLQVIEEIKELLAKMEKILTVTGGIPSPEIIPENMKSDAPSAKTTWMIIFVILIFVGSLGLIIFMTWFKRAAAEKSILPNDSRDLPGDFPHAQTKNRVA
jgi:hypothetical protein